MDLEQAIDLQESGLQAFGAPDFGPQESALQSHVAAWPRALARADSGWWRAATCSVFLSWVLAGCSGGSPQPSLSDSAAGTTRMASGVAQAGVGRIPNERLEELQFKSIWVNTELRQRVVQAWHSGTDVYVTTERRDEAEQVKYTLIKINGETGIVDWTFPLRGKLDHRPTAYQYPRELQGTRAPELYLSQETVIYCIDDRFGAENYRIEVQVPISTPVAVAQDHIIFGSWNNRAYGYSKNRRLEEWTYITGSPITADPVVGGVNVYFGSEDNSLYCLNIGAGFQQGKSWDKASGGKIVAAPVFYNSRVYYGSWDYKVYCRDEYQGLLRWSYPCEAPVVAPVFPFRDMIYAVATREDQGTHHRLVALDRATGRRAWERPGMKQVLAADPYHCFVLDAQKTLFALRHEDGAPTWQLDCARFDFVLGQDADQGRASDRQGRMVVIQSGAQGFLQCIEPRR